MGDGWMGGGVKSFRVKPILCKVRLRLSLVGLLTILILLELLYIYREIRFNEPKATLVRLIIEFLSWMHSHPTYPNTPKQPTHSYLDKYQTRICQPVN